MITAAGVADTLRLLVPGFVALKAFYLFGLRSKRSDLQWTLWSVLVSAPIAAAITVTGVTDPNQQLALGLVLALIGGVVLGEGWARASKRWVRLQAATDIRAWDTVLTRSDWVQVWTKSGRSFTGHPQFVASSAESDDLDFYLEEPQEVFPDGTTDDLDTIEGFLISRSSLDNLAVLAQTAPGSSGGPEAEAG